MKMALFSFLVVAFAVQAQASQVVAEVQLSPSTRSARIHYAHWIKKYPVEFKQGKCNQLPDSDLPETCSIPTKFEPRLIVTLNVDNGPLAEIDYQDVVLNPKDMSYTKDRLEKLFTVSLEKKTVKGPITSTFCQGEIPNEVVCETETYIGDITTVKAIVSRK